MSACTIVRLGKGSMIRALHDQPTFSEQLLVYLLSHNMRLEEDLVDQLFNSTEKRLARVLLLLANFWKEGKPEPVIAKISQETLEGIIGTTRSRVSFPYLRTLPAHPLLDRRAGADHSPARAEG